MKWIPAYADVMGILFTIFLMLSIWSYYQIEKAEVAAASVPELKTEIATLTEGITQAQDEIENADGVIKSQKEELEKTRNELADVSQEHQIEDAQKAATINQQQKQIGELSQEVADRTVAAENYRREAEGVIADHIRALKDAQGELASLNTKRRLDDAMRLEAISQLQAKVDQLTEKVTSSTEQAATLGKSLSQAEAVIVDQKREIDELTGQIASMNVQAKRDSEQNEAAMTGYHLQITHLTSQLGELKQQHSLLQSRLRSGSPVSVVVVIDVTASMGESIDNLRSAMATLFEFMPNTSEDFRVGIVAFRDGVVSRFPVTQIKPRYEDNGVSQKQVLEFLGSLEATHGYTDHLPAFREAFSMIKTAHPKTDPNRKERIIFLGDSGPSELDQIAGFSDLERTRMKEIRKELLEWTQSGNRAVASLYAENSFTEQDVASIESREWYETLGSLSPNSAFYTDTNAVLRAILNASQN